MMTCKLDTCTATDASSSKLLNLIILSSWTTQQPNSTSYKNSSSCGNIRESRTAEWKKERLAEEKCKDEEAEWKKKGQKAGARRSRSCEAQQQKETDAEKEAQRGRGGGGGRQREGNKEKKEKERDDEEKEDKEN